jgi:hypothetical protein
MDAAIWSLNYIQENVWLMYAQYGGSPVKVGDEEYHLFRDHE